MLTDSPTSLNQNIQHKAPETMQTPMNEIVENGE